MRLLLDTNGVCKRIQERKREKQAEELLIHFPFDVLSRLEWYLKPKRFVRTRVQPWQGKTLIEEKLVEYLWMYIMSSKLEMPEMFAKLAQPHRRMSSVHYMDH